GPIASENFDVCTVGASEDSRAWTRLNAVELAREHRLVRSGAVLQWHDLDLEAMPRPEITLTYHQHEPGIAFWLDYAVLPRLEVLPQGPRSSACRPRQENDVRAATDCHDDGYHVIIGESPTSIRFLALFLCWSFDHPSTAFANETAEAFSDSKVMSILVAEDLARVSSNH